MDDIMMQNSLLDIDLNRNPAFTRFSNGFAEISEFKAKYPNIFFCESDFKRALRKLPPDGSFPVCFPCEDFYLESDRFSYYCCIIGFT